MTYSVSWVDWLVPVWCWHFECCDFPGLSVEGADGER